MTSIPASAIVNVYPSVLAAGGTGLDLGGLILTNSNRVPVDAVREFSSAAAVAAFFGALSDEALVAVNYFAGFDGSSIKPASLLFSQYPAVAVAAYLRGGNVSSLTLAELQALTGVLTLTIDGEEVTSATINLTAAASFSAAAALIQAGIGHFDAVVTGAIAGTTLTVSAVADGALAIGQVISGTGITAGTRITALGTGTGGVGTYTVSVSQTAASGTVSAGPATVAFDSQSGAFVVTAGTPGATSNISFATGTLAAGLALTAATGATLSQGADATTPGEAMTAIAARTQNFATFTTLFKPSTDDMVLFAAWAHGTLNRWLYVLWDNDITVTTAVTPVSAGTQIAAADYSGTLLIYDPTRGVNVATFVMGAIASIDFSRTEGRTNLAFLRQAGLVAGVTNKAIADNLIANGYNFYGSYATANDEFVFLYPGSVAGPFEWADSFVNQIWLNNAFQLARMVLLTTVRNIPYNSDGYALIEASLFGVVNQAVDFGAIRAGVPLSSAQAAYVNGQAGLDISDTITQRGWYLQVSPASAEVRAARASPPCTFWYTDGQSVQSINLNSVQVQ